MTNLDNKIIQALKKTFPKSEIPKKIENLKIGDLKGWDSLGHVNLILEIEKIFSFKFGSKIFLSLQSIKKIKKNLPK
jgi:acyl carrier protein|tara:strand:- start:246 stop:476 length:231 start_codon:yes stop_codon:yes gene_type:complete